MRITDEMLYACGAEARDIWLGALPDESEAPAFQCSRGFERKMRRLLREQRRSPKTNRLLSHVRRAAVVALAFLAVSFAGLMTVDAYRGKAISFIVEVFHELTQYRFVSEAEETEMPETFLGYIPDGMKLVEREEKTLRRYTLYEDDSGRFFELVERPLPESGASVKIVDSEEAETRFFDIHGNEATAYSKNGHHTIIWSEKNILYDLHGSLALTELKAIAEQIKIE